MEDEQSLREDFEYWGQAAGDQISSYLPEGPREENRGEGPSSVHDVAAFGSGNIPPQHYRSQAIIKPSNDLRTGSGGDVTRSMNHFNLASQLPSSALQHVSSRSVRPNDYNLSGDVVLEGSRSRTSLPSIASILSGEHTTYHGVETGITYSQMDSRREHMRHRLLYENAARREEEKIQNDMQRFEHSVLNNPSPVVRRSFYDGVPPPGLLFQEDDNNYSSHRISPRARDTTVSQDHPSSREHYRSDGTLHDHVPLQRLPRRVPLPELPIEPQRVKSVQTKKPRLNPKSKTGKGTNDARNRVEPSPPSAPVAETSRAAQRRVEVESLSPLHSNLGPPYSVFHPSLNPFPGHSNTLPMRASAMEPPSAAMPTPGIYGTIYSMITPGEVTGRPSYALYPPPQPALQDPVKAGPSSTQPREPEGGRVRTTTKSSTTRVSNASPRRHPRRQNRRDGVLPIPVECPMPGCDATFNTWLPFVCHMSERHNLNKMQGIAGSSRCPIPGCPLSRILMAQHVVDHHTGFYKPRSSKS